MTISYEVRKAVVLLKHSSFFDKIFEKRYCTKNFLIAVSYTHLDVYKRQHYKVTANTWPLLPV